MESMDTPNPNTSNTWIDRHVPRPWCGARLPLWRGHRAQSQLSSETPVTMTSRNQSFGTGSLVRPEHPEHLERPEPEQLRSSPGWTSSAQRPSCPAGLFFKAPQDAPPPQRHQCTQRASSLLSQKPLLPADKSVPGRPLPRSSRGFPSFEHTPACKASQVPALQDAPPPCQKLYTRQASSFFSRMPLLRTDISMPSGPLPCSPGWPS